jgi:hypothetical protein
MRAAALAALLLGLPVAVAAHGFTAEENAWFNRQVAIDGMKCCDDRAAHVAPDVEWRHRAGRYEVRIRGAWVPVPPGRIMRDNLADPSPWGQAALLFHSPQGQIWCFRPEPLM